VGSFSGHCANGEAWQMPDDIKKRLEAMTREEQEKRFNELRHKLGIAEPKALVGSADPPTTTLKEYVEYQLLKKLLG
jgi:hypothetical protein